MSADYTKASLLATRLLLEQRLYNLRINVVSLCYDKNIVFSTFDEFCGKTRVTLATLTSQLNDCDGYTIIKRTLEGVSYIVLYNEKVRSRGRKSFTLAHEVGHIYLGHSQDTREEETEANCFAAQLLLPSELVWEFLCRNNFAVSAYETAEVFGVSLSAAENRMRSFKDQVNPIFSAEDMMLLKKYGGLLPHFDGPVVDL